MNKYIIESKGYFNNSHISSKTFGNYSGYKPLYEGGCFAIIPNNDKFILFGEDDDNYFEQKVINKKELLQLQKIYSDLDKDIKVTIDYIKCKSKQKYFIPKKEFFNKERTVGKWKVKITDRGRDTAPLVTINENQFDISHAKNRLKVINDVLKELEL